MNALAPLQRNMMALTSLPVLPCRYQLPPSHGHPALAAGVIVNTLTDQYQLMNLFAGIFYHAIEL